MPGIFISYRRDDSAGHAGRLFDRLKEYFGKDRVFMDVTGIEPGVDFVEAIDQAVGSCDVLLVVIGKEWLDCTDAAGHRRLDDPNDFVRLETGTALRRKVRVVPVLVQNAAMPSPEQLPEDLKPLARRQATELTDVRWESDTADLIRTLEKLIAPSPAVGAEPVKVAANGTRNWAILAIAVLLTGGGVATWRLWPKNALAPQGVGIPPQHQAKGAPAPARLTPEAGGKTGSSLGTGTIDLGTVTAGSRGKSKGVPIINTGSLPLVVERVTLLPETGTPFTVSAGQCIGKPITPGARCIIQIGFAPATPGNFSANLVVYDNSPYSGQGVALAGVAVAPQAPLRSPVAEAKEVAEAKGIAEAKGPRILAFEYDQHTGRLCYVIHGAVRARIDPDVGPLTQVEKDCVAVTPEHATTYTLRAANRESRTVRRELTVAGNRVERRELLRVTPERIDFGSQEVCTQSERTAVTLSNTSQRSLTIKRIAAGGHVKEFPYSGCEGRTLAPGEQCVLSAFFSPKQTGELQSVVYVRHSASDQPAGLVLRGTGAAEGWCCIGPDVFPTHAATCKKLRGYYSTNQGSVERFCGNKRDIPAMLKGLKECPSR